MVFAFLRSKKPGTSYLKLAFSRQLVAVGMVVKNSGKWRVLLFLFLFLACVLFSLFCSGAYAICERRQRPGAGRAAGREGQGARAGSEAEARSGIE